MREFIKLVGAGIGVLILMMAILWVATGNEFFLYKFFAPKRAAVEREVFENTKSYNQGMIQELDAFCLEYQKSDQKHKDAIVSVVRHRYADFNESRLPSHLRACLSEMRR